MHVFLSELVHRASIAQIKIVCCRNPSNCIFNQFDQPLVLCKSRNIGLRVLKRVYLCGNETSKIRCLARTLVMPFRILFRLECQTHGLTVTYTYFQRFTLRFWVDVILKKFTRNRFFHFITYGSNDHSICSVLLRFFCGEFAPSCPGWPWGLPWMTQSHPKLIPLYSEITSFPSTPFRAITVQGTSCALTVSALQERPAEAVALAEC